MCVRDILPAIREFKIFDHGRLLDLKRFGFITLWRQTPCTLFVSCTANETSNSNQMSTILKSCAMNAVDTAEWKPKKLRSDDQEFGCDMLCPMPELKWKSCLKKGDQP